MTPPTAIRPDDSGRDTQRGTIDWSILNSMKMLQQPGKPDPRIRLMSLYLTTSPPLMEGIRSAIASRDGEALMNAAHSLKSSSMSLGATGLGGICARLEQQGRANSLDEAPSLLDQAEAEFAAVTAAFRQVVDQDAHP